MNKGVVGALAIFAIGLVAVVVRKQHSEMAEPASGPAAQSTVPAYTIAVIPKGTTHSYWKSVEAGAKAAGQDLNVQIQYKGPLQEDDAAGQIALVQEFISDKVSGIVLAPLNDTALLGAVQSATAAKIPVVIIDSGLKGEVGKDYVTYVGTNNTLGGKMAGDQMAKILGGNGKLVLLRYVEGSASTSQREQGFLDAVHERPGLSMLVDNRYGGASVSEAQSMSLNLLDQLRQADGVFCPNESSSIGMLHALEQNNLAGKIHFVGFDATPPLVDALKKGEIDALVSQDPMKMGRLGVQACVDDLNGKPQPPVIDSGVQLITRDNLSDPAVQKLLSGS
jgi:ribose transport system substrate-binding protein